MRLSYIALVAVLALASGSSSVAARTTSQTDISQVVSSDVAATVIAETEKRHLRVEKTADESEDEEKGLLEYQWDGVVTKNTYRLWYLAGMTPKQVKRMLKQREADGDDVHWKLYTGYTKYYRKKQNELIRLYDPNGLTS
ncbi:unnamed protein product [Phytophthora lilii]|uniref:RxLR effector protein n=1 Tax=Phytophthora lilii TaxID=2077276 RepID=A0A9W6U7L5_9STRA|nr:unnamed protein product [Phytophthora lilii]